MNFQKQIYIIVLFCLALSQGCKKTELPVLTNEAVVFSIQGTLDTGQELSFSGGEDDYFLFTDYAKDSDNIYTFSGEWRDLNCSAACSNSLKISISDFEKSTNNIVNISNSLNPNRNYLVEELDSFSITEQSILNLFGDVENVLGNDTEFSWSIEDTLNLIGQNISIPFNFTQDMVICLEVSDNSICNSKTCSTILNNSNLSSRCVSDFHIIDTLNNPNMPFFLAINEEIINGNNFFQWSSGETNSVIEATLGSYELNVATDSCWGTMQKDISFIQGEIYACTPDFSYNFETETLITSLDSTSLFSRVTIEYINENGSLFSSELAEQDSLSFFDIESIEEYEKNENGEATAKLDFSFSILLQNQQGVLLRLENASGTLGVAYPD